MRKFLRDILLRVSKGIILISVGVQRHKLLRFANLVPSVFLILFDFGKERTRQIRARRKRSQIAVL